MTDDEPLLARIAKIGKLTESESILSAYFEKTYPQIAFDNLEKISLVCAVSKATVTRFVRRLGYGDFRSFSRALKDELAQNFDSPLDRQARAGTDLSTDSPADMLRRHLTLGQHNLQKTLTQIDDFAFATVMELVSNSKRPLFLMSAATGRMVLGYFYLLAKYQRPDVHLLGGTDRLAHDIIDVTASSVLLATSFDRYPTSVMAAMHHFHDIGAETILITNRRSNPLLRYAKHTLFVHTDAETIFKSRASMLVMLEAIVSGMGAGRTAEENSRFKDMEKLFREFSVFLTRDQE